MDSFGSRRAHLRSSMSSSSISSSGAVSANTSTRDTSPDPLLAASQRQPQTAVEKHQYLGNKMNESGTDGNSQANINMARGVELPHESLRVGRMAPQTGADAYGQSQPVTPSSRRLTIASGSALGQVPVTSNPFPFRRSLGSSARTGWRVTAPLPLVSTGASFPSISTSTLANIPLPFSTTGFVQSSAFELAPTSTSSPYPSPTPSSNPVTSIYHPFSPALTSISNNQPGATTTVNTYNFQGQDPLEDNISTPLMISNSQDQSGQAPVGLYKFPPLFSPSDAAQTTGSSMASQLQYYCLERGNGCYTRLIPADMLPDLVGIPKTQPDHDGMLVLPDLKSTVEGVNSNTQPVQLKVSLVPSSTLVDVIKS